MPRELSARETAYVNDLITGLCRRLRLNERDPEYRGAGWEGFLDIYRHEPNAFLYSGKRGWKRAAEAICLRLETIKTQRDTALFRDVSLDAPVSPETETTRLDLYRGVHFDFQNSVCFWDYLNRLDEWSRDAKLLAVWLASGETLDEIRTEYRWECDRIDRAMEALRLAMMEYLET